MSEKCCGEKLHRPPRPNCDHLSDYLPRSAYILFLLLLLTQSFNLGQTEKPHSRQQQRASVTFFQLYLNSASSFSLLLREYLPRQDRGAAVPLIYF